MFNKKGILRKITWAGEHVINSMPGAILNSLQGRVRKILPYMPAEIIRKRERRVPSACAFGIQGNGYAKEELWAPSA
jgi:hypothetical protein